MSLASINFMAPGRHGKRFGNYRQRNPPRGLRRGGLYTPVVSDKSTELWVSISKMLQSYEEQPQFSEAICINDILTANSLPPLILKDEALSSVRVSLQRPLKTWLADYTKNCLESGVPVRSLEALTRLNVALKMADSKHTIGPKVGAVGLNVKFDCASTGVSVLELEEYVQEKLNELEALMSSDSSRRPLRELIKSNPAPSLAIEPSGQETRQTNDRAFGNILGSSVNFNDKQSDSDSDSGGSYIDSHSRWNAESSRLRKLSTSSRLSTSSNFKSKWLKRESSVASNASRSSDASGRSNHLLRRMGITRSTYSKGNARSENTPAKSQQSNAAASENKRKESVGSVSDDDPLTTRSGLAGWLF